MADVTHSHGRESSTHGSAATDCTVGELLSAYLDGELRAGELEVVVEHLADCLECVAEFHDLKEARAAVRMMPMLQVPDKALPAAHYGPELSAFLDGELSPQEQAAIVKHLESCTECLLELQDLDASRTAIRSLPGIEPAEPIAARLPVRAQRTSLKRLAVAAAGFIAAAVIAVNMISAGPPATPVDLDQFADQHNVRLSVEDGVTGVPVIAPGATP